MLIQSFLEQRHSDKLGSLDFSKADDGRSVSGILFTAVVSSSPYLVFTAFTLADDPSGEFSIEGSDERGL